MTLLYTAFGAAFEQPIDVSWRALLLHPITLEFVFGMLAARAVLSAARWPLWASIAVAVVALLCFMLDGMQRVHSPLLGLAIAGALVGWCGPNGAAGCASARPRCCSAMRRTPSTVHMPLMSLVARTTRRFGPLATWPVNLLLSVSAALLLGVVYHLCYERIALRHARRVLERRVVQ